MGHLIGTSFFAVALAVGSTILLSTIAHGALYQDVILELPVVDSLEMAKRPLDNRLEVIEEFERRVPYLKTVVSDQEGRVFIIETGSRKIRVFQDNKLIAAFSGGFDDNQEISYLTDGEGRLLAMGRRDRRAHVYDYSGELLLTLQFEKKDFTDLRLVSGQVMKVSSGQILGSVAGALSSSAKRLWLTDLDIEPDVKGDKVRVLSSAEGVSGDLPLHIGDLRFFKAISLDKHGRLFCVYSRDGQTTLGEKTLAFHCIVFDIKSGFKKLAEIKHHPTYVDSETGDTLSVYSDGKKFKVTRWQIQ